ncbi:MAG: glutamate--tRNA ligase [Nitrospinae bacterium]|nr:glutamate--tRNA ligase [Nitrospinota bacterium]
MNGVRVRFAPSPTGYLHIGGVRTALFNWLFARHNNGKFILRIEDTDRERSTEESIEQIIEGMKWLGLDWDEGPYRQTERQQIYLSHAERLLNEGKAYRCYCTSKELEERRKTALSKGEKPKYDGRCRELNPPAPPLLKGGEGGFDKPYAVRFKTPQEGKTVFTDLLRGEVVFDNSELDDLIILRSDKTPTYNFCVVIDDATMNITHVIRGDDHLANTPRQIQLYNGLGYPIPQFAHISMILGSDKARLSKRHGATSILAYRDMGYLPEAIVNYLVRLGWSHGDQEIFGRDELIKYFSLENINKSAAVFNPEKLLWVNSHYIKTGNPLRLAKDLRPHLVAEKLIPPHTPPLTSPLSPPSEGGEGEVVKGGERGDLITDEEIAKVIPLLQERSKTLVEMAKGMEFYLSKDIKYDEKAVEKFFTPSIEPVFERLIEILEKTEDFSHSSIEGVFNKVVEEFKIKLGQAAQPVRIALTGKTVSPGIFEVISLLGKEKVIERLKTTLQRLL